MSFIDGGIKGATTKKALRESVKTDASKVTFFVVVK